MIINDLDLGGDHPSPSPTVGQRIGDAFIVGSRTIIYPLGAQVETQDLTFIVTAWQALGGSAAMSMGALRYRLRQLEQLASNPDLQPVYIQFAATAQSGELNIATAQDGWYVIESLQIDYETFEPAGWARARMTVKQVAPATPSFLAARYDGAALASSYSAAATALISFPVGAFFIPQTTLSRTGGEGAVPSSSAPVPNPLPFARPGTIAALFTGGCRVYDTINTGTNPVPVAGGVFVNANWVEVKGTQHDFVGDCVVTNGLLLLLYASGQGFLPRTYLWNTSLGTPTWQLIGDVEYFDNAAGLGVVHDINLDRVGLQEVRVRIVAGNAAGNHALLKQKLLAGAYHVYDDNSALTQNHTAQYNRAWIPAAAYATGFTDSASSTVFPSNLAPTTASGYSAAQGSAAGSPIFGFLYQNAPTTAQGRLANTTEFDVGDTVGPVQGSAKLYGFFAVPYSGAVVLATAQGIVAPIFQQFKFDRTVRWVRG